MDGILVEFYEHNLWANLRLLDACAALTDEQLDADAPGTFGSARDTLVHLLAAEGRYVALLTETRPEQMLSERDPFPGLPALRERARVSGEALIGIARQARADQTVTNVRQGETVTMPVTLPMLQAINHATEHRAHVVSVLSGHGAEMPEIDGWIYYEAKASR